MPFSAQQLKTARRHLMNGDPRMRRIVQAVGPCTIRCHRDRFVALTRSIVSQQISSAAANTIWNRLLTAVAPGKLTAERLVQFDLDQLRELGVSRQKATYLLDLAHRTHQGEIAFDRFGRLDDETIIEQLTQVRGIGRWTVQMFLIFSLARPDVLAVDDLGIKSAIRREYQLSELPKPQQIVEIARPWRPYASIASWYLWRTSE